MGVLVCVWMIGSGIHGVRNRKGNSLAYFIISIGQIVVGVEGLIIIIIGFLAKELGIDFWGLLPK
jgi:hypothetical protein